MDHRIYILGWHLGKRHAYWKGMMLKSEKTVHGVVQVECIYQFGIQVLQMLNKQTLIISWYKLFLCVAIPQHHDS